MAIHALENSCIEKNKKKSRMSKSKFKAMLIVFFHINSVVMTEWVPEGQTVNEPYYLKVLATLRE